MPIFQYATGIRDMGDVTDETSPARFGLSDQPWSLSFIRARFSGGTGSASLTLRLDSHRGSDYDFTLGTLTKMGTGDRANMNFRIKADETDHWTFRGGDQLVLEWTNPDGGTMRWALEVGINAADSD